MAACMIAITVVTALYDEQLAKGLVDSGAFSQLPADTTNSAASYGTLVLLCLFIAIFALSW